MARLTLVGPDGQRIVCVGAGIPTAAALEAYAANGWRVER